MEDYQNADVNVPSGEPILQSKDITINQNGTTTVTADTGYDGLSDVDVTVSGILDTSDATATASDIAQNKTAYVNGVKLTGTAEEGYIFSTDYSTILDYSVNITKNYFSEIKKVLLPYLQNPITIYSPGSQFDKFIIYERGSNLGYRIVWVNSDCIPLDNRYDSLGLFKEFGLQYFYDYVNKIDSSSIGAITDTNKMVAVENCKMSSTSFNSVEDLLNTLKDPSGSITYSQPTGTANFSISRNTVFITNMFVLDSIQHSLSEKCYSLSDNVTIVFSE